MCPEVPRRALLFCDLRAGEEGTILAHLGCHFRVFAQHQMFSAVVPGRGLWVAENFRYSTWEQAVTYLLALFLFFSHIKKNCCLSTVVSIFPSPLPPPQSLTFNGTYRVSAAVLSPFHSLSHLILITRSTTVIFILEMRNWV